MNYTMGIDMGVTSLGWAVVSEEDRFIDTGVRVFPAGIDKLGTNKETHPNIKRRSSRTARRRCARKAERKKLMRQILTDLGWIPTAAKLIRDWESLDPYELRHRAIKEKVSLPELARIILHLNQRRGFLSLRKSDLDAAQGNEKKELEGLRGDMNRLQKTIEESGHRTLGNHLYQLRKEEVRTKTGVANPGEAEHKKFDNIIRLRARHIHRHMLHHEFDLIWKKQAEHHPSELTHTLRYGSHGKQKDPTAVTRPIRRKTDQTILEQFGIENLTFFQRRVYWPLSSIGKCELQPDELRAPVADRRFQEFRMLHELNNLRILDHSAPGKPEERKLSEEEREVAINYLSSTQKPTLKVLKKKIAKLPGSPAEAQITFNLEANKRENISGLATENKLAKTLKSTWQKLDEATKNQIVEILALPDNSNQNKAIQRTDHETRALLEQVPDLTESDISKLLETALPPGYGHLSVVALEKILIHMRKGHIYQGKRDEDHLSARHLAGYPRRDEISSNTFKELPSLVQLTNPDDQTHYDPHFPHVNNPLVLRSLHELRKVVNAIIKKHGTPSDIHLEMARDLKMSEKQRQEHSKKTKQHEKEREEAKAELEKYNIAPTRDAILLYRLWKEQDSTCIYSGKTISIREHLFGGDIEIDHIYPRRATDDSYMNKVVCFAEQNRLKGDQIPVEWLGEGSPQFEDMTQRAKKLPYPKRTRLLADKIPEGFAERDAVDTAYMTRVARHYLSVLFPRKEEHRIFCLKGKHTALLRNHWQLNGLLNKDLIDVKNRYDHRHHALDAIVIATCDRSLLQKVSKNLIYQNRWKEKQNREDKESKETIRIYRLKPQLDNLPAPWPEFRLAVTASLNSIWVSHRADRKISGALHEETNYGATGEEGFICVRKHLHKKTSGSQGTTITPSELFRIRDKSVRRAIVDHLIQQKAFKAELLPTELPNKTQKIINKIMGIKESITFEDLEKIDDDEVRDSILKKFIESKSYKKAFQDAENGRITLPSGTPIKKVRLLIPNKSAVPLRPKSNPKELVIPGNTHHLAIFTLGDGKCHFEPVTLLEVSRRKREQSPYLKKIKALRQAGKIEEARSLTRQIPPIVRKTFPGMPPEAEFRFHLCKGDSMTAEINGKKTLFIFNGVHAVDFTAKFVSHIDATPAHKDPDIAEKKKLYEIQMEDWKNGLLPEKPLKPKASLEIFCNPNTFEERFPKAEKVEVLPNGEIQKVS